MQSADATARKSRSTNGFWTGSAPVRAGSSRGMPGIGLVDRYVARTYVGGYFLLVIVGMGLYILTDLLLNLEEFTKDRNLPLTVVATNVASYYGYNLPLYFSQLAGPVMAVSAAFTLAVMLRNNELTALISSGMPLQRLAAPIIACTLELIVLWALNREIVLPSVASKVVRPRGDVLGQKAIGVNCVRDDRNAIVTALKFYPREKRLKQVFIVEPDAHGAPANLVEADQADYDESRGVWVLTNGRRIDMGDPRDDIGMGAGIRPQVVREYPLTLSPEDLLLREGSEWADLLSTRQLARLIRGQNVANKPALVMSQHVRLTQPLVQIVLVLLALPFFLTREPVSVLAAGGQALVLTGLFFLFAFVAHSLGGGWPALTAWLPILVFGPVAVVRLGNVKT